MLRFRLGLRRFAEQGFFPQLAQQLFQFAPLLFRCLGGLVETGIGRRSEAGRGQGRGQDAQGRQQQPEQEQGQQERQQPAKTTAAGSGHGHGCRCSGGRRGSHGDGAAHTAEVLRHGTDGSRGKAPVHQYGLAAHGPEIVFLGVLQDQGEHLAGQGLAALGVLSPLFRQVQDVPGQLPGTGPQAFRLFGGERAYRRGGPVHAGVPVDALLAGIVLWLGDEGRMGRTQVLGDDAADLGVAVRGEDALAGQGAHGVALAGKQENAHGLTPFWPSAFPSCACAAAGVAAAWENPMPISRK